MPFEIEALECVLPDFFVKSRASFTSDFIANEDLIVAHNTRPITCQPNIHYCLYAHAHYLFVYNRYTQAWVQPVHFPPPFDYVAEHDDCWCMHFVGSRTFAMAFDGRRLRPPNLAGHIHLVYCTISDDLDDLSIGKSLNTTVVRHSRTVQPQFARVFLSSSDVLRVFIAIGDDAYFLERGVAASSPSSRGGRGQPEMRMIQHIDKRCEFAMLHDGELYVLAGDQRLYVCDASSGELSPAAGAAFASDSATVCCKPPLTYLRRYSCKFVADLSTRFCVSLVKTGSFGFRGLLTGGVFESEARHGLYSQDLIPSTMATIALRVIHKHLTKTTAVRLAEATQIRRPVDLVDYLMKCKK